MGTFIKQLWLVWVERAKARKAMRLLTKQAWSVEFLTYIMAKSTELNRKGCHCVLRNPDGQELIIYSGMPKDNNELKHKEENLDIRQEHITWESVRDAAEIAGIL